MKLQLLSTLVALIPSTVGYPGLAHFREYHSLAGLSQEQIRAVARTFNSTPGAQPVPFAINDTSSKLVNDGDHPWQALRPGDIRGPCPGLNTLASHGYIDRSGVATPGDIITAAQQGFNMGWGLAAFVTYAAFIVDGNHLTNLMSIGANVTEMQQLTGGLNIHGNFEGDASTTRGDYYFGNNYSFNETLFEQLAEAANLVGNGMITLQSAALDKSMRINDSIARNPTFNFECPRVLTAYAETTFPLAFFVNNQNANSTLNLTLDDARSFFEFNRYPEGFYRRRAPYDFVEVGTMLSEVVSMVRVPPGHNEGLGNFVTSSWDTATACYGYGIQANLTAKLYPDPTGELLAALIANLETFYQTLQDPTCPQLFPFGQ